MSVVSVENEISVERLGKRSWKATVVYWVRIGGGTWQSDHVSYARTQEKAIAKARRKAFKLNDEVKLPRFKVPTVPEGPRIEPRP